MHYYVGVYWGLLGGYLFCHASGLQIVIFLMILFAIIYKYEGFFKNTCGFLFFERFGYLMLS